MSPSPTCAATRNFGAPPDRRPSGLGAKTRYRDAEVEQTLECIDKLTHTRSTETTLKLLDLGTGSGAVVALASERPHIKCTPVTSV